MSFDQIIEHIKSHLGASFVADTDFNASPQAIITEASSLHELMVFLHQNEQLYFDSLSCLTALDGGVDSATLELVYNLYSIPFDHHLMVKVSLDKEQPKISSLVDIWQTADWHEREAFDLMGIQFVGHPDLRRILLPADWEGHPLRKDYKEQQYYRGVKVKY